MIRLLAVSQLLILCVWSLDSGQTNQTVKPPNRETPHLTAYGWTQRPDPKDKRKQPWIYKDWTEWTEKDCGTMLDNSPWSHRTAYMGLPQTRPAYIETFVQLRSALPIRQAILRVLQIKNHYDRMDTQKKLEFDRIHASEFAGRSEENVVVVITNDALEPPSRYVLPTGPNPATQVALLLSDGTRVQPAQINKVNYDSTTIYESMNQFEYTFPRAVSGKPLYSPGDESLIVLFGAQLVVDEKTGEAQNQPLRLAIGEYVFATLDLMYKNQLEY